MLEDFGRFVKANTEETFANEVSKHVKGLPFCTVNLTASVISIRAKLESSNETAAKIFSVTPHQPVML